VDELLNCFRYSSPAVKDRYRKTLANTMAGLNDLQEKPVSYFQLAQALIDGFRAELGIDFTEGNLSSQERDLAEKIRQEKGQL